MTYEPIVFPDAEAVIAALLRTETSQRVENRVPNPRPDTFLLVRRVGGVRSSLVSDAATLTVEAWDLTDENAKDLIAVARAHVLAAIGRTVNGAQIYRVDEFAGPVNLPDPISDHFRQTITVSVHLRGAVHAS